MTARRSSRKKRWKRAERSPRSSLRTSAMRKRALPLTAGTRRRTSLSIGASIPPSTRTRTSIPCGLPPRRIRGSGRSRERGSGRSREVPRRAGLWRPSAGTEVPSRERTAISSKRRKAKTNLPSPLTCMSAISSSSAFRMKRASGTRTTQTAAVRAAGSISKKTSI